MTGKDLLALMECRRKYELQMLSLKGGNEKILHFNRALSMLAEGIAKGCEKHRLIRELTEYLEAEYQEEWFYLNWQKEKAVMKDIYYLSRFLDAYRFSPKSRIMANFPVEVTVSSVCREMEVGIVSAKADLLLQDEEGTVTGIILCQRFRKPYSYHARLAGHQVMNSVEMLVLLEGLMKTFPEREVRVQMIRMITPSDILCSKFCESEGAQLRDHFVREKSFWFIH